MEEKQQIILANQDGGTVTGEGEVDPEPVYIPTPSVIEPIKPLVLPQPDLSSTTKGKLTPGIKPARTYTPKPNPVIREEDKDPVYLYFESMMTCARVRVYERKKEEQRQLSPPLSPSSSFQQQSSCYSSPENRVTKELDSEQTLKQLICDLEDDSDKSQEKSWKSSCNEGESSSTSYVHQRSPGGPTKLIEIISDCNWEEDRNKILSILSQHINSNMPQSLKVNGKSYPQAKLLLGQMGALHPANRLAAYITGRLRPSVLDLSTLSTVISKVASNAKVAASRKPRTLLPSTSNSKMASSGPATNRSGKNLKAFVPAKRPIENAPQIPVTTPQISSNNVKRTGPRLLLIPVQQGSPTLRPIQNPQLQGQRMVLQPVRGPSGMNLFRHPNGQIVQLLPLHQIRGSNAQPSLQPVVFRNPGSMVGIRLPAPCKSSETPSSSASSSAFSVMSPVIQAVGSSPTVNVISQAPSLLSSGSSFVSQAGTLTLRISPPETQNLASKTGSESKITPSTGGQPVGTASLIPLQSGSFALLQLPGQKPIPSSVLQHVASLQIKKESQSTDQKDETNSIKREEETKKALPSKDKALDSEANIMKQNSGIIASENTSNNSLDDGGDLLDEETLREDARPYEYSYSTGSHTDEDKDGDEDSGNKNQNSPKEKQTVPEVRAGSKNIDIMALQSIRSIRPQKCVKVKVEPQEGSDNPENPDDFLVLSKDSKFELSGNQVKEQQSNSQAEAKKDCEDSLGKDSLRERWRKHLKGPLTQKYIGISQNFNKEANVQFFTEMKPCQENSEQDISELLGKSGTIESGGVLKTEDGSWSGISSSAAFSIIPRRATKGRRGSRHFQGHLLLPREQMKPKQQTKDGRSSAADFTVLDLEDEDEEDEKTDDSLDEIVDVVSGYQSEEVDVEKNNYVDYLEDDEQVDVETIEELSEEINFPYKKTTATHTQSFKQQCHSHISADEKASEKSRKVSLISSKLKDDCWGDKPHKETEAFAYYRRTHTANERRRRGEMRDLF